MTEDDEPTRESVRVLTRRTPAATGWAAADVVRRTAVIRHRRRFIAGVGAVVLAAAGLALTTRGTPGQGAPPLATVPGTHVGARIGSAVQLVADAAPLAPSDRAAIASVADAEQRLAIRLLQTVDAPGNVSVSPESLYLALGMLQTGARGETRNQISAALQAAGLSTTEQNAGLAGLTDELAAAAKDAGIALESANSIWQETGFPIRKQFLADLATYYRAGVWQADFAGHNAGALAAINNWTAQHTHRKIQKLFDQLDPSTVLVLANAIFFHADWATPFDPRETLPGPFITDTGKRITAKFMMRESGLSASVGRDYEAAQLPYRGRRFEALAIMPTSGSLANYVAGLTPSTIDSIAGSMHTYFQVVLPRFTTTSSVDLKPVLEKLGMTDAFGPRADLSGISSVPTMIDQVVQRAYLSVQEKGTTAAAVTGIAVNSLSLPPQVRFDHPFLFLIRDTQTGAILFASKIDDPTAS